MSYRQTKEQILNQFNSHADRGLSAEEVASRIQQYGKNEFVSEKKKSVLRLFFEQVNSALIYILIAAAIISASVGEISDAIIIGLVILLNSIIGVFQELKAERALEELQKMSNPVAIVIRDGATKEVGADELVPGDIVLLDAGRIVPADLRLIESANLQIEESALTGESLPVEKDANWTTTEEAPLGDRKNSAFMSTIATYGRGKGIVTATGMDTEIGKIAGMLNQEKTEPTPLQSRLAKLGKVLGILAILICAAIFAVGYLQGRDPLDMFLIAVSLAVAAIPEGLPAIVTIVLALGMQRLVKRKSIVRKLPAVETLGSVNIICSDKTGTLTQNKMTVQQVMTSASIKSLQELNIDSFEEKRLLEAMILCNDATLEQDNQTGDPTEIALLAAGQKFGLERSELNQQFPRVHEIPFDSDRKRMTTVHRTEGSHLVMTKGAIDQILPLAEHQLKDGQIIPLTAQDKEQLLQLSEELSQQAIRVLAAAYKETDQPEQPMEQLESDLIWIGFVGMIDPPREEVKASIATTKIAGIKTVMITGDHKLTAFAIAKELGIASSQEEIISGAELDQLSDQQLKERCVDLTVYARVSPEHKVKIVQALKSNGNIVSMTGDGVNDAPSLKQADVGVAMGITGTDVSKGAADIVLTDDNFATIVAAIEEGRNIYNNIKKSVLFLLSCNIGELIALFVAILLGWPAPLAAIHILWVNLVTDTLPAISLGVDPGTSDVMKEKPRDPKEGFLTGIGGRFIIFNGIVISILTLAGFLIGVQVYSGSDSILTINFSSLSEDAFVHAQTMAFMVLSVSQLIHSLNLRSFDRSIVQVGLFSNKYLLGSIVIGIALQFAVVNIPFFADIFRIHSLNLMDWLIIGGLSLVPLIANELWKLVRRARAQA